MLTINVLIKLILISIASAISIFLMFNLNKFYDEKLTLNTAFSKICINQRKVFTVFISFFIFYLWALLFQIILTDNLPRLFSGLINGLLCSSIFLVLSRFFSYKGKKIQGYSQNIVFFIIHGVLCFPVFNALAALSYNKVSNLYSSLNYKNIIFILICVTVVYLVLQELLYQLNNYNFKKLNRVFGKNEKDLSGDYILNTGNGKPNSLYIRKKDNIMYVSIPDFDVKVRGEEDSGRILADLSGELPRITLHYISENQLVGTFTINENNTLKIIPLYAIKNLPAAG